LLFGAPVASAGPLGDITDPVTEAAAPVKETVETVVAPVTTAPPPAEPPPPVKLPEVQVPAVPVKVPPVKVQEAPVNVPSRGANPSSAPAVVQTGKQVAETAADTVAAAGRSVTSAAARETGETEQVVASGATAPGQAPSAAEGRSMVDQRPPASADGPGVLAAVPLLHPFIHVWPAIALLARNQLGEFLWRWSQAALALSQEHDAGSVSEPAQARATARDGEGDPGSSSLPPPLGDDLNREGSGVPIMLLLLVLSLGGLLFTMVFRYEEGEPLLPRRLTRWWH
jgi:hypothetical protein